MIKTLVLFALACLFAAMTTMAGMSAYDNLKSYFYWKNRESIIITYEDRRTRLYFGILEMFFCLAAFLFTAAAITAAFTL